MYSPPDHLTDHHADNPWQVQAACRGFDVEMFFSEAAGGNHAAVIKVCDNCPVRGDCLADALVEEGHWGARYGIRGGLTGIQRKHLARTVA